MGRRMSLPKVSTITMGLYGCCQTLKPAFIWP